MFGFLSGAVLANNSIVTNDMIGSEDKEALLCYTSNFVCCNKVHNEREVSGQWYDPAGERVPNRDDATSKGLSVYRNRYQSVVRLYRVMNKMLPSGIFRCEVEDAGGSLQRIYVGVYPEGEGWFARIKMLYS